MVTNYVTDVTYGGATVDLVIRPCSVLHYATSTQHSGLTQRLCISEPDFNVLLTSLRLFNVT